MAKGWIKKPKPKEAEQPPKRRVPYTHPSSK